MDHHLNNLFRSPLLSLQFNHPRHHRCHQYQNRHQSLVVNRHANLLQSLQDSQLLDHLDFLHLNRHQNRPVSQLHIRRNSHFQGHLADPPYNLNLVQRLCQLLSQAFIQQSNLHHNLLDLLLILRRHILQNNPFHGRRHVHLHNQVRIHRMFPLPNRLRNRQHNLWLNPPVYPLHSHLLSLPCGQFLIPAVCLLLNHPRNLLICLIRTPLQSHHDSLLLSHLVNLLANPHLILRSSHLQGLHLYHLVNHRLDPRLILPDLRLPFPPPSHQSNLPTNQLINRRPCPLNSLIQYRLVFLQGSQSVVPPVCLLYSQVLSHPDSQPHNLRRIQAVSLLPNPLDNPSHILLAFHRINLLLIRLNLHFPIQHLDRPRFQHHSHLESHLLSPRHDPVDILPLNHLVDQQNNHLLSLQRCHLRILHLYLQSNLLRSHHEGPLFNHHPDLLRSHHPSHLPRRLVSQFLIQPRCQRHNLHHLPLSNRHHSRREVPLSNHFQNHRCIRRLNRHLLLQINRFLDLVLNQAYNLQPLHLDSLLRSQAENLLNSLLQDHQAIHQCSPLHTHPVNQLLTHLVSHLNSPHQSPQSSRRRNPLLHPHSNLPHIRAGNLQISRRRDRQEYRLLSLPRSHHIVLYQNPLVSHRHSHHQGQLVSQLRNHHQSQHSSLPVNPLVNPRLNHLELRLVSHHQSLQDCRRLSHRYYRPGSHLADQVVYLPINRRVDLPRFQLPIHPINRPNSPHHDHLVCRHLNQHQVQLNKNQVNRLIILLLNHQLSRLEDLLVNRLLIHLGNHQRNHRGLQHVSPQLHRVDSHQGGQAVTRLSHHRVYPRLNHLFDHLVNRQSNRLLNHLVSQRHNQLDSR